MAYVLGFTTQYYTLWNVGEPYKKYTAGATINGVFTGSYYMAQDYVYLQNLSKDYEAAVAKIAEKSGGVYTVNLELCGQYSFTREISGTRGNDIPEYAFTFGQLQGHDIRTATDIWQLNRAKNEELGKRRRVYARRRLIELGELVRNTVGAIFGDDGRWVSPKRLAILQERIGKQEASGHHYENGKRITLVVKCVGRYSFDTQYGTCFIREYMTEDGKLIKYKGSSPVDVSAEEYTTIIGTVEHGDYKGQPETRLKRIKKIEQQ